MDFMKRFRVAIARGALGLTVLLFLFSVPAYSVDSEDSQIFISGFNAYQKKDYPAAIEKMETVLQKYPDTPLRDMALFWLARAQYKAGKPQEAAKQMALFLKEYPDSPLKATVEDDLLEMATAVGKREQAEQERIAAEKAAQEKAAAEKAVAEAAAREKSEAERLAAEKDALLKAETERLAAEKAAMAKLEQDRIAAEKVAQEKADAERLAAEREAREHQEQMARERAESERLAAAKAEAERKPSDIAVVAKAEQGQAAPEKISAERTLMQSAEAERLAAERAHREKAEKERVVAAKKSKRERGRLAKAPSLKDKAVEEFKTVIDKFPGTNAAAVAAAKLRELGIVYPPARTVTDRGAGTKEAAQVLSLEVGQAAEADFIISPAGYVYEAGKRVAIPFEVVNRGNGQDGFYLESGFPAEFNAQFAAGARPDVAINSTPKLAPGEKFSGVLVITVPRNDIDGQKHLHAIKLASQQARDASQSREVFITTSAPMLRAVVKADKGLVLPGDRVSYSVALLNVGTATAQGVTFRLHYPPQFEPVDFGRDGFRQEMKAALVMDGVQLRSGESRQFTISFQVKEEALANQELLCNADVINTELQRQESFVSAPVVVKPNAGVAVKTRTERIAVIPGQTVSFPLTITNTGNLRDSFTLRGEAGAGLVCNFYLDINRDGKRQPDEPLIKRIGPLSPKEVAHVVLEISTPDSASDGTTVSVTIGAGSESDTSKRMAIAATLGFSRPVIELTMAGKGGKLKPGEVSSFDLSAINTGSNLARVVEVRSQLPAELEVVASDPAYGVTRGGEYVWTFAEMGPGEKRLIRVSFRVRSGVPVGTGLQIKNMMKYEDQLGNRY